MAAAVEVRGLVKRFGATEALSRFDAEITAGRLTGLVGPDGAGKTTLLRLMAALMTPTEGTVSVEGLDVVDDAARVHRITGYMPQRFGLYEDLTVRENLELYVRLRGSDATDRSAAYERLLGFTGLEPFADRLAGRLSGGMKQKLGLACALVGRPRVLLLDEPSVGVDPVSRQMLWKMVGELVHGGMAVVWSTAYLDEAEHCDHVLLLDGGELAFAGPPGELTRRVAGRSVRVGGSTESTGSTGSWTGARRVFLAEALESPAVRDGVIQGDGVRLVLAEGGTARQEIERLAAGHGGAVEPVAPRFEDAFIALLGGGPGGRSAIADSMGRLELETEVAVSCRGLTKRFGDFTATDDVGFEVRRGEIFGLLGPNGAGKSTTFKMLCGLLRPTAGEARVAGHDLRTAGGEAKLRLGYMAQKFSLYGLLSVRQNLDFFSAVYGLSGRRRRARVDEMVSTFGLERYLDESPQTLPLGFKQRLALACALMHRPPVLFLDEPTSGVDPITRREFWTHINGLVRNGVTVLVTTHFMDEAEYCDRVALVHRGRIVALDSPAGLASGVAGPGRSAPTLEETFIALIEAEEARSEEQAA